jgi:rubrerythrin
MSDPRINLEMVDRDGAVREAAAEAAVAMESGSTRLQFVKRTALAGGALVGGGALLGAVAAPGAFAASPVGQPPASFGAGDIGILNYALTLEYLESAFYNQAAANGAVTDPKTRMFLRAVKKDEAEHVAFLVKALGSSAAKQPTFNFGETTKQQSMFQATSYVLENTGVEAYFGQASNIMNVAYVKAALSIMAVEARHAGAIGLILKGESGVAPTTAGGPFQNALPASSVLAAVKATGFIVG